jgi:putative peptide zinc metalloprotease protein
MSSTPPIPPELTSGIETRDFGTYAIAASPVGGSMLYLKPDEFALLPLMDGQHSPQDLEARLGRPVEDLIVDLREEGYLVDSPDRKKHRELILTLNGFEFDGFDRVISWVNRKFGDRIFSARGLVTAVVVGLVGLVAFLVQLCLGQGLTVPVTQPILAFFVLRIMSFSQAGLHESSHALVIDRNGRHVGRFGIGFYWGALSFYVDASQAMFFDRRTRMKESGAGLFTDFVFAGAVSLVAVLGGGATWAIALRELAVITYLGIILNAIPLLELDGYWILADALNRPSLHHDSLVALQAALRGKFDDVRLALYAAASTIFGAAALVAGVLAFWNLFGKLFHALWAGGAGYKVLAVFLVLPYTMIVVELLLEPLVLLVRKLETKRHLRKSRKNAAAT